MLLVYCYAPKKTKNLQIQIQAKKVWIFGKELFLLFFHFSPKGVTTLTTIDNGMEQTKKLNNLV